MQTWRTGNKLHRSLVSVAELPGSRVAPFGRSELQTAIGRVREAHAYAALFAACVVSRVLSTIYYIEDTDSLRFALSMQEYSIAKLQPHFPGYPVFCFVTKLLYAVTGSFALAFSLVGAISVFGIIYFLLQILDVRLTSAPGGLVAALVFFNPLIWLMSNRYMPDLFGVACALAAFYCLWGAAHNDRKADLGFFLAGVLAGSRLSYVPFVLVPVVARLARRRGQNALRGIGFGALGVLVWLVPLWLLTGGEALISAAQRQTEGHFTDFGGTVITDPLLSERLIGLLKGVLADGLGGYWPMRHWITLGVSAGLAVLLIAGVSPLARRLSREARWIMIGSWITYFFWILLYQNVIYKSRHVLPLLPFLLLVAAIGSWELLRRRSRLGGLAVTLFLVCYAAVTLILVQQHRRPTAIAQVAEYLRANPDESRYVVSIPLVNYYLSAQAVSARFLSVDGVAELDALQRLPEGSDVIVVGSDPAAWGAQPEEVRTFFHNPYVNRMWSEIAVFEYQVGRR